MAPEDHHAEMSPIATSVSKCLPQAALESARARRADDRIERVRAGMFHRDNSPMHPSAAQVALLIGQNLRAVDLLKRVMSAGDDAAALSQEINGFLKEIEK